jgi:hypothetical protein
VIVGSSTNCGSEGFARRASEGVRSGTVGFSRFPIVSLGLLWISYGFLWFSYGFLRFPMVSYGFLRFSYDFPIVSYGFLWFPYGFP